MSEKDSRDDSADTLSDEHVEAEISSIDDQLAEQESPSVTARADVTDSVVASPAPSAQPAPAKRSGKGLALLALLLALIALAVVGWQWMSNDSSRSSDSNTARINGLQSDLDALANRLEAIEGGQSQANGGWQSADAAQLERLESIEQQLAQLARDRLEAPEPGLNQSQVEALVDARVSSLDQRLASLTQAQAGIESRIDDQEGTAQPAISPVQQTLDRDLILKLDLLEAAAMLSIGQARLELAGDQLAAIAAYRQANQMLSASPDGRLNQVKQRLAEELLQIESVVQPDWTAAAAQLAQWEQQVQDWPLRPTESAEEGATDSESAEENGWFSGMRSSLGQLVTVERRDGLALDAEVITSLHEQLRLQLASAGLALERRDLETLRLRLDQVGQLIETYFDTENDSVSAVQAELVSLAELELAAPPNGLGQAAATLDQVIDSL
ncbi:MAG: uroporphyrinogen-III C-methyltransferase [Pseudomonadota bacterium]